MSTLFSGRHIIGVPRIGKFLRNILTNIWSLGRHKPKTWRSVLFIDGLWFAWQTKQSIVNPNTFMKFAMHCSTRWWTLPMHCETLPTHSKIISACWKAFPTGWNTLQCVVNAFFNPFLMHFQLISYAGFSQIGSHLTKSTCKFSIYIKLWLSNHLWPQKCTRSLPDS